MTGVRSLPFVVLVERLVKAHISSRVYFVGVSLPRAVMSFVTSFKWARTLRGPRAFAMGIVLVAFALFMWRRGGR